MKLLTFCAHESYLQTLAKLGHPMDVVVNLPGHHATTWDERMRPVPDNVRLLPLEELMANPPQFDCLIGHNISDLLQTKVEGQASGPPPPPLAPRPRALYLQCPKCSRWRDAHALKLLSRGIWGSITCGSCRSATQAKKWQCECLQRWRV